VTRAPPRASQTAAWAAELPPPTTPTRWGAAELRLGWPGGVEDAQALVFLEMIDRQFAVFGAGREQDRLRRDFVAVLQLHHVVTLAARFERECPVGGRGAGGELARLDDRAADQFRAADPGGEAKVVLDPPRGPRLPAEHVALDHERVEALGGAVDRRAEPRRAAADDQQVDLFALGQLQPDPERSRKLAFARPVQVAAARQSHQRQPLCLQVGDQSRRLGVGAGVAPEVGEPLPARVLDQFAGRLIIGRADDVDADPFAVLQAFAPLHEGGEQQVGEIAVLEQQRPQRFALDFDVAQGLADDRGEKDRLAGEEVHLAEESRGLLAHHLVVVGVENRHLALTDRDERVDLVADFEEDVADLRGPLSAMLREHVEL